jgi:glycosyltransferase involved in cell wall biosynthesis
MRILIINKTFLGEGGGDYHMTKVARNWSKSQQVQIIRPAMDRLTHYIILSKKQTTALIMTIFCYSIRILESLFLSPKEQFDIIISSSHYPPDILSTILFHLRCPRSKIAVYYHGLLIPKHGALTEFFSILYNYIGIILTISFADLIFTINDTERRRLLRLNPKSMRLIVTSNGVDFPSNESREQKLFDACFLGRLNRSKGVLDLVTIWNEVCKNRRDAKLVVIGTGPEMDCIKVMIAEAELNCNIILLGWVEDHLKSRLFSNSRMFIFPSYLESWGIAIAEAMACGLPVVAYNLPVYKEVFEDKLITIPLGDIDAMARQVIFLLENPDVARRMGEANKEFVRRYDWSVVAEKELSEIIAVYG